MLDMIIYQRSDLLLSDRITKKLTLNYIKVLYSTTLTYISCTQRFKRNNNHTNVDKI